MIPYDCPIPQTTGVNKTVSENVYRGSVCLYIDVHIFYYCSNYWSDASLVTM